MFDALSLKILQAQNECTLSWITQDGSPAATVVSFIYEQECLWMTTPAGSVRERALMRDGRVAVVVSGKGCDLGDTRCVSMRGHCEILRDAATRDMFFPLFARKVLHKSRIGAPLMAKSMNTSANVVLKFTPSKVIPFDAQKMMKVARFF